MGLEEQVDQWGAIVAKAWEDGTFKQRLLDEPAAVLREHGMSAPPGVELRVMENTDKVMYLPLPARPQDGELADDELDAVSGGLVVNAIIGTFHSLLLPSSPRGGDPSGGAFAGARAKGTIKGKV